MDVRSKAILDLHLDPFAIHDEHGWIDVRFAEPSFRNDMVAMDVCQCGLARIGQKLTLNAVQYFAECNQLGVDVWFDPGVTFHVQLHPTCGEFEAWKARRAIYFWQLKLYFRHFALLLRIARSRRAMHQIPPPPRLSPLPASTRSTWTSNPPRELPSGWRECDDFLADTVY